MGKNVPQKCLLLVMSGLMNLILGTDAMGLHQWVVGNRDNPWGRTATLEAIDTVTHPGWIRPEQISPDENLALGATARGGGISSPQPSMKRQETKEYEGSKGKNLMKNMIDRDPETAFEMDEESARTAVWGFVVLDLGETIPGVNRIKFYPRDAFEDRFMRAYELFVNDGSPESITEDGVLLWQSVAKEEKNSRSTVEINTSPQYVRYIKLQSNTSLRWEIAELEVYGEGFVPRATYTSEIIDLGGLANFGDLKWSARIDPRAGMDLRTRSGKTSDPFIYYKLEVVPGDTIEVPLPEPGKPGTAKEQYEKLKETQRRKCLDTENWSFWSAPYGISEREPIISPSLRRYFQFKIELFSNLYTDKVEIDSLAFDYSSPVIAHEIKAEISPRTVPAGEVVIFEYTLRPTIRGDDTGFDALEISTPMEVDSTTIRDLTINGSPVTDFSKEVSKHGFILYFPRITGDALLKFFFACRVLVYGTSFGAKVFDSQALEELPQYPDSETSRLSVKVSLSERLVSAAKASPNPFTPNGDGVNDYTNISYQILKLLEPAPVSVTIYDLSGSQTWNHSENQQNGLYEVMWDGRDDDKKPVPPGVYIYQIFVDADANADVEVGAVVVVY